MTDLDFEALADEAERGYEIELNPAPPPELLQPFTGEVIPAGDVPKLAEALDQLRDLKHRLNLATQQFTDALVAESRRQGTKTLTAAGWEIKLSADSTVEWDVSVLTELLDAGLPQDRYDQLVTAVVTYKVDGRIVRQLEAASPEYKAIIERARTRVPKRVYATVQGQP